MTTGPSDNGDPGKLTRETAQDLVDEIIEKYGREISAKEVLAEHEELRQFRSCVVDLAYEEYANAKEDGREIEATEFVQQFEGVEQSLYRMLEFDQVLRDNPSLVEPIPEERWPRKGQEYHNFLLLSDVGRGALSRVFLAKHTQLGEKPVIVKVCVRGQREAGLLGSLAHPSIGEVHSLHEDENSGLAVICMPYQTRSTIHEVAEWLANERSDGRTDFTGQTVSDHIQEESRIHLEGMEPEPFAGLATGYFDDDPFDQLVAKWGIDICSALGHAHQKGVLHCDVKPGNILLLPDLSIRLLDFNLATKQEDKARMAGGTPPFMAPEQLELMLAMTRTPADQSGSAPEVTIDERADVFGLCATLWHLVTGEPPFGSSAESRSAEEAAESMLARQNVGVGSNVVAAARKKVPAALVDVLLRGLSLDADERQASVEDLKQELSGCVRRRRRRLPWVLASVVALASLIAGGSAFIYVDPAESAMAEAREAFQTREFGDAADALKPFRTATPRFQVWELAARTCDEALFARDQGKARQEAHFLRQWGRLSEEWTTLAEDSPYAVECWYNKYLTLTAVEDHRRAMKEAAEALSNAIDAGLDTTEFRADVLALELYRTQSPEDINREIYNEALGGAKELSRGQFFFLLASLKKVIELYPYESEQAEELRKPIRELFPWIGSAECPFEKQVFARLAFTGTRNREWAELFNRCGGASDTLVSIPNRLSDSLLLPDQEVSQIQTTARYAGQTIGHAAGQLRATRKWNTKRPGVKR